jgi:hypothetical protein
MSTGMDLLEAEPGEGDRRLVLAKDGMPLLWDPDTIWALRAKHRLLPRPIGISSHRSKGLREVSLTESSPERPSVLW